MKLSLRSEYALMSLIQVARRPNLVNSSKFIADSQRIPPETLYEVLRVLIDSKYLRLSKGNCQLAKPADKISVAEIIRLFDGALAPLEPVSEMGYFPAPMDNEEKLAGLFSQIQEQAISTLEITTLADLV